MANKSETRRLENLPTRGKINPISATSQDQRINHYEVDESRSYWRVPRSKLTKPRRKDHKG